MKITPLQCHIPKFLNITSHKTNSTNLLKQKNIPTMITFYQSLNNLVNKFPPNSIKSNHLNNLDNLEPIQIPIIIKIPIKNSNILMLYKNTNKITKIAASKMITPIHYKTQLKTLYNNPV